MKKLLNIIYNRPILILIIKHLLFNINTNERLTL